jgi:DNA topoisomerase-1
MNLNTSFRPDKEALVKELKKLAKSAEEIWLATDEDREGEAISWHLCEVLGLNAKNAKRIVFHEITKKAIQDAVAKPRFINIDLVDAQQARRILDRIVGFELSPLLWRKINMKTSLSAGRVQSVAVRVLVEREHEINAFKPVASYKITANFIVKDENGREYTLKADLPERLEQEGDAEKFVNDCNGAKFAVANIAVKPAKRTPSAPFTTSTLQQEASTKLGFSVARTMMIAQKLYEEGHITYMRTDSVNLGDQAMDAIKSEIVKNYGDKYANPRKFKTKSAGAQEAHEAIRPTYMENQEVEADFDEKRLYKLIWKRTMASQMADAELEKTVVDINISSRKENLVAKGEIIKFDGFLKVYTEALEDVKDEDATLLPPLKIGQDLALVEMIGAQKFSKPGARYTEASLVKKLEELGIGRPSTYAPTISTIQKREYVEKKDKEGIERAFIQYTLSGGKVQKQTLTETFGAERMKLFPTDLGILVTDFLITNFPQILDYNFTANVEEQFDEIAVGKIDWHKMIDDFYKPFHAHMEVTTKTAQKITGERYLGVHPNGEPLKVMMGKYGAMVVMGETLDPKELKNNPDAKKPKFAGLLKTQNMAELTLEDAIKLFELPKTIGTYREDDVVVGIGRFGPYVRNMKKFYSIPKGTEAASITLEEAIELILAKDEKDANKLIHDFPEHEVQVLNGQYGAYIKKGKENYKIPKDKVAKDLTLDDVLDIIKNTDPSVKGKKRFAKKK